jgi:anti-anti-sigma factor
VPVLRTIGFQVEPQLQLRAEADGVATILWVGGEIDMATAPQFSAYVGALAGDVIVDLSAVQFLDSSGMAVLARTHKRLAGAGGSLFLRDPGAVVRRALEIGGFAPWIL